MGEIKVVFFYVDGTLAQHNSGNNSSILERIPDSTFQAIDLLQKTEVIPVIATGRNRGMIEQVLQKLGINNLIANNGRYVEVNGKVIKHDTFDQQQLKEIVTFFRNRDIPFCYETAETLYQNRFSKFIPDSSMTIKQISDTVIPDEVIQLIVRNETNEQLKVPVKGVKLVKVAHDVYDVTQDFSNKAVGISAFMSECQINQQQTMAFGDEENDLEMFKHVHMAIAMGNAPKIVQQAADFVTDPIDQNGILHGLKHFGLI
ncbi:HAD-IIB family hydrolase [Companilactobacillus furfuricola]|uniref:HAD-IIB family hydrolase n=1 Tax=Companilactobacillus furfuricola TaxID=1462575 RepID=UPI0013DE5690|nr:HAD-IIB family hydrolase [Companilactobacillus furfuricola]